MRKIAFIVTAALALSILTGCTPYADERAACENSGGTVKTEKFTYSTKGFLGNKKTGRFSYCENAETITAVYKKQITEENSGLINPNTPNAQILKECTAREGKTYKTVYTSGKNQHHTRYVCILNGEYYQVLP